MKYTSLLMAAAISLAMLSATAQDKSNVKTYEAKPVIQSKTLKADAPLRVSEVMPSFPGGPNALAKFMGENLKYPKYEKSEKIEGRVIAQFNVLKDGSLDDINVIKSVDGSKNLDKEVIRVIKSMPKWNPGKQNGQIVKTQKTLPVSFKL